MSSLCPPKSRLPSALPPESCFLHPILGSPVLGWMQPQGDGLGSSHAPLSLPQPSPAPHFLWPPRLRAHPAAGNAPEVFMSGIKPWGIFGGARI